MKKKIMLCLILIILLISAKYVIKEKNKNYINHDGIMLALSLDGESITKFPTGTNYFVEVNCKNAKGKWSTAEWKLNVSDIKGNVLCDINFKTRGNKYLLKTIVESNTTNQEGYRVPNSSSKWTTLSQSQYINVKNNSSYPYKFNNNKWTSTATVKETYSDFTFNFDDNSYYRVCYEVPASSSATGHAFEKNFIKLSLLDTSSGSGGYEELIYSNYNNGSTITGCYDYGNVTKENYITIRGHYYDKNISFYVMKTKDLLDYDPGYRYQGKKPNNYVWFNDELWRIIGSIPTCTTNGCSTKESLIKIIRNDSLGYLGFNTSSGDGGAYWGNNTLYTLLNNYYYGKLNATGNSPCYIEDTTLGVCDYRYNGISSDTNNYYNKMLKSVYWPIGAIGDPESVSYAYWRENLSFTNNNIKIGLMNYSDYGYAGSSATENWLHNYGSQLTLTPFNGSLVKVTNRSYIYASDGASVRPAVYLNPNVYVVSGDGTQSNPYQIAM